MALGIPNADLSRKEFGTINGSVELFDAEFISDADYFSELPSFTTQPTNQTASVGSTATFTSVAIGPPDPTYQWQVNKKPDVPSVLFNADLQSLYIYEASGHTVPAMNTAWTICGNYKFISDVNLTTVLVAKYGETVGSTFIGLFLDADGSTLRISGNNGGGIVYSTNGLALYPGTQLRLAITYDGAGTVTAYNDGLVFATLSFTPNAGTTGQRSLVWGGYGEITGYTNAEFSNWKYWSGSALTADQIMAEHRSLDPVITTNLIGWWPMDPTVTYITDQFGNNDLLENPAVPHTAGNILVQQPSLVGEPVYIDLGTVADLGSQNINVPTGAEGVIVHLYGSSDGADVTRILSSISSNFTNTFTVTSITAGAGHACGSVAWAKVTSTGAKTIHAVWNGVNTVGGAGMFVFFIDNIDKNDFIVDIDIAATIDGYSPSTATVDSTSDGLVLAVDSRFYTPATQIYPSLPPGFTTLSTSLTAGGTYQMSTRASADYTPGVTTSASTQDTYASVITLSSIKVVQPWEDITLNGTSSSYTTPSATLSMNKWRYRVIATNPAGSTISNTATLTVTQAAGGFVNYWNGSAWIQGVLKYWNGSAWIQGTLKSWNGSSWVS